jgi:hypothetical protein
MGGESSTHGTDEKCINISAGNTKGKRKFGRQRRRWKDHRMDVREIVWEVAGWMHLAQDRGQWRALMKTVMNLAVRFH